MPYEWTTRARRDAPVAALDLWPYRSLPKRGFVWFIGGTAALIALPLVIVIGSPILWGLLPFFGLALGGIWWGLQRSYRDGSTLEELRAGPDRITLTRHDPGGTTRRWDANPHWVEIRVRQDGPVEHYLTLRGGGREVEIGAFLAVEERQRLEVELREMLAALA